MAAALAGAIVSLLGTAANIGMGIWSNQKAKNAKTGQIGVSGAEQAALTSSRYLADRMAMQGGMSAAQYQRALQEPDLQAAMTQQTVNQLATTPFQDSFQREALAKVMMSRMFAERQRTFQNIADIDAAQIARNVSSAFGAQAQVAQQEAMAQAQRNAIIARNEQIQENRWNTFANMLGNIGQMAGMSAEGIELALKERNRNQSANASAAQSSGIAGTLSNPQAAATANAIDEVTTPKTLDMTYLNQVGTVGEPTVRTTRPASGNSGFSDPYKQEMLDSMMAAIDPYSGQPVNPTALYDALRFGDFTGV